MAIFDRHKLKHPMRVLVSLKNNLLDIAHEIRRAGVLVVKIPLMLNVFLGRVLLRMPILPRMQLECDRRYRPRPQRHRDWRFALFQLLHFHRLRAGADETIVSVAKTTSPRPRRAPHRDMVHPLFAFAAIGTDQEKLRNQPPRSRARLSHHLPPFPALRSTSSTVTRTRSPDLNFGLWSTRIDTRLPYAQNSTVSNVSLTRLRFIGSAPLAPLAEWLPLARATDTTPAAIPDSALPNASPTHATPPSCFQSERIAPYASFATLPSTSSFAASHALYSICLSLKVT